MTDELILRPVSKLDLVHSAWDWPFARDRRVEIDAHFIELRRAKPELFNGRMLMARDPVFSGDTFSARYFETDYASFLAWRDWGFPDTSVFNGFGMGALRTSDGAFVLGEMAGHTANAGKIYFPAGTPDLNDLRGSVVDIPGSVTRETAEEVGLTPADYRAADHWDIVESGRLTAMIRILDLSEPGEIVRARIEAELATQADQELSAIHLVRSKRDFTETMPSYIRAFLAAKL
jgi:8-oxo-dGTP pyrophosphatase MutT (NUDIX family)